MCFNNNLFRNDYRRFRCSTYAYNAKRSTEEIFAMNLLSGMNDLRQEGAFCDIILRVGERTIRAHKIVISANSAYFRAMFSGTFLESGQQEITIKEVDADCLELLINYMYTGMLNVNSDNAKNLIMTAAFLQITSAEELCCKLIKRKLDANNCIEYMLFARRNSTKRLMQMALEMGAFHFFDLFFKNDYLELEFEEMKQLTDLSKEMGYPEDILYSFVLRWMNYSYEARVNSIKDLLELLNPLLISPSVLHSSDVVNITNPVFTVWAAQANATSTTTTNEPADHILVSQRLEIFGPLRIKIFSEAKHRQIGLLPNWITDGSYVCNGYYIYHQGGWSREELITDSYVYHPSNCQWVSFVPLQEARAHHSSCVLNGRIFSVGGSNGVKAISSVEYTDMYTGQRGFIDPLPRAKERTGLGLLENAIYIIGGSDRGMPYKCIHRFDVREGVWHELAPSPYRAGASSCAVIGESIYTTHPDTLQRYDIRANDWAMISAEYKRYPPEVFAIDNTLFGLFNDHVARFIPEEGKWENQRTLNCSLPNLQVSTNLLFPNVNEEEISDPVFEGLDKENESDST